MSIYMSDKDQVQMIKDWWKKHGTTILLAIAVFLAANFGVQYWHKYTVQKKALASILYTQMFNSYTQNKPSEAKLFAQSLMKNYSRSPYASFAAMILAKTAIDNNKLEDALLNLRWVIKNAKSPMLRQLAQSREARILLAQSQPAKALEVLQTSNQKQIFAAAINEIRGDALLLQNNEKDAIKAYAEASNYSPKEIKSPLLQMKKEILNDE